MFYALYDESKDKERLLTCHVIHSSELGFIVRDMPGESLLSVGHYPTSIVYMTSSLVQIKLLMEEGILKTNKGNIMDVVWLDSSLDRSKLKIVQVYSGVRVIGSDMVCMPTNGVVGKTA